MLKRSLTGYLSTIALSCLMIFAFSIPTNAQLAPASCPVRPLVFVPGILGTRLVDTRSGDLLWGSAKALSQLDKLIISDGPKNPASNGDIQTDGLVDDVSVFGAWKTKQYSELKKQLQLLGYENGKTYLEFPYDWRQSNFLTAKKLKEFVSEKLGEDVEFDILAHSMGGLASDIFIKRFDTHKKTRRFITMGTPFLGSTNTFSTLQEGWGSLENWLSGGLNTVRRFALSTPSFYELLPNYPNCCRRGVPDQSQAYDPLSFDGWSLIDWLPDHQRPSEDQVRAALLAAQELHKVVQEQYPSTVEPSVIAGARIETRWKHWVDPKTRSIHSFESETGDGTVPELSAVNRRPDRAFISFSQHAMIFEDDSVSETLRRILCGTPPPEDRNDTNVSIVTEGKVTSFDRIGVRVVPAIVQVGNSVSVEVEIVAKLDQRVDLAQVSATIDNVTHPLTLFANQELSNLRRVTFSGSFGPFYEPRVFEISINISGLAKTLFEHATVLTHE